MLFKAPRSAGNASGLGARIETTFSQAQAWVRLTPRRDVKKLARPTIVQNWHESNFRASAEGITWKGR